MTAKPTQNWEDMVKEEEGENGGTVKQPPTIDPRTIDPRTIRPQDISFSLGKPLTREEFLKMRAERMRNGGGDVKLFKAEEKK